MVAAYRFDRKGVSEHGVAMKANLRFADVKQARLSQHATPRFAQKMD